MTSRQGSASKCDEWDVTICSVHVLTTYARYSLVVHAKHDVSVDMDAVGLMARETWSAPVRRKICRSRCTIICAQSGCLDTLIAYRLRSVRVDPAGVSVSPDNE
jgi:hypothetical protein